MRNGEYKNIPNCLRKYRKAIGLKQKDVAKIIGLKNSGIISRWEKGICLPSALNIFKLAALYRTLVDALFIDLVRIVKKKILKGEEALKEKQA
jgi:transcriptional regulator with XRE-family HTH domain